MNKTCNTCKIEKPLTEFYKRKDHYKDPYRSDCRSCLAAKASKRYGDDPKKFNARDKKWREANPDKEKARGVRWRAENPELAKQRAIAWRKSNRDKYNNNIQRYRKAHPDRINYQTSLRRAAKLSATPKWLTKEHKKKIAQIYESASILTRTTGIRYHVDHIVPLRGKEVSGLHVPWNLRVITAKLNSKKSNKHRK